MKSLLCLALAFVSVACTSGGGDGADGSNSAPEGGARFFLPTGKPDNTSAPKIEVDAKGNTHAVYPAYAVGGAYYAFCGDGCQNEDDTKVVRFDTDGTTTNAMLALDAAGHPRVLLSAYRTVYYGTCDADCGEEASWTVSPILEHDGERDVTGEAFTLDADGHPLFLLHTRVAYLGIGQKDPETRLVSCDASCGEAGSWKSSVIADEIWQGSHLRYGKDGKLRATTVLTAKDGGQAVDTAAYVDCEGDCSTPEAWGGIALGPAYQSEGEAVAIHPTVAMALTKDGHPRAAAFIEADDGTKRIAYLECDDDCRADNWRGLVLSSSSSIDQGLDVALDANDRPRVVYTLDYNIGLWSCDEGDCSSDVGWSLDVVEAGSDMPADEIMPYPNCTVGMWFLHGPSIAITPGGEPRVGYQARDISGGTANPDHDSADCVAGTDMTWSRLALLPKTAK